MKATRFLAQEVKLWRIVLVLCAVLLLAALMSLAAFELSNRDRHRCTRTIAVARALRIYDNDHGVLPSTVEQARSALRYADPNVAVIGNAGARDRSGSPPSSSHRTRGRYVLWGKRTPASASDLAGSHGDDFVIAAESKPSRRFALFGRQDLCVVTASFTVAAIKCGRNGADVLGTRLSDHVIIWHLGPIEVEE